MNIGDIIHGFIVTSGSEVPEVQGTAYMLRHQKSGAELLYVKTEDDNKVFYAAFATPPADDTGVAHIVEHSVLCGSRKYPLKEPFVELVKGSLNTFLNAMTYPDKTVYPVASRNDQDFKNLMDVYLDAVFYPDMLNNPNILKQEGWHYELAGEDAPLKYSGVVYNEMKGALSAPDSRLGSKIMQALFPDSAYGFESGGDPAAIPELTQEKFGEFHRKYYHPSNCRLYLYGDMDIEERLQFLDEEYLSKFTKIEAAGKIEPPKPFGQMRRVHEEYAVEGGRDTREKTFLSFGMVLDGMQSPEKLLALEILTHILFKAEAAPVREALIAANLGSDVDAELEGDLLTPMFTVTVTNSEAERADKFLQLTMDTLRETAQKGLSPTLVESAVAAAEFKLREADFGSAPKGLIYGLRVLKGWNYGKDPVQYLRYEEYLQHIKDGSTKGYFEKLIEEVFIKNQHKVLLTMTPSADLEAREEKKLADKLAQIKRGMTKEDLARVMAEEQELKIRQQTPDTAEALAKIPLLKLSDIKKTCEHFPLEERRAAGAKVLFSDVDTNGICYLNLYFDALTVPQEKLPLLYFLTDIIAATDTKKRGYGELDELLNLKTGGFAAELGASDETDPAAFNPRLRIEVKALLSNIEAMFDLTAEILTESLFTDKKRIKDLLAETISDMELSFHRNAHNLVASRISRNLTMCGYYSDEGYLPCYRFLKELAADFDNRFDAFAADAADICQKAFNRKNIIASVTMKDSDYPLFEKAFNGFIKKLPNVDLPRQNYEMPPKEGKTGLLATGEVQYVGKGANFIRLGHEYTGALQVLSTVLRYEYFWTKIRVQGGAYGAFANFSRTGNLFFGSYRDPRLGETIDVFDGAADFVKNFAADEREITKYVIGTISNIDMPKTPRGKGYTATQLYFAGITDEMRQKSRDEILSVTAEKIRALAPLIDAAMKENNLCVFGGEKALKDNEKLFDKLIETAQ